MKTTYDEYPAGVIIPLRYIATEAADILDPEQESWPFASAEVYDICAAEIAAALRGCVNGLDSILLPYDIDCPEAARLVTALWRAGRRGQRVIADGESGIRMSSGKTAVLHLDLTEGDEALAVFDHDGGAPLVDIRLETGDDLTQALVLVAVALTSSASFPMDTPTWVTTCTLVTTGLSGMVARAGGALDDGMSYAMAARDIGREDLADAAHLYYMMTRTEVAR